MKQLGCTRRRVGAFFTAVAATGLIGLGVVSAQTVDPARSRVGITFKQMGVPVDAVFKTFRAQVTFDAAKLVEAKANIEIDVGSFDMGEAEYNAEVRKKEWFNAAAFPIATFVASGARSVGPGRFEVPGKLTLKGRMQDVVAPVAVRTEGGAQIFEGQLPIKRLAFSIGEGEWKDTSMVADEVIIKFRIATVR